VKRDAEFGRRLKEVMAGLRISPGELAEGMKVRPGTVSRWRSGELPGEIRMERVARLIGVRTNWLRTGQGERDAEFLEEGEIDRRSVAMAAVEAAVVRATAQFVPYLVSGPEMPVVDALGILDRLSLELGAKRAGLPGESGGTATGNGG
jgi:transcriptional regulator with XRE-family HTH domain